MNKPVYHVVAMARNRVIGKDNQLPWHFPEDLKRFKQLTMGNTIVMGRKTYDSIGRPLPGRENFVLTRTEREDAEHLKHFNAIEEALKNVDTEKAFIIGGANIYEQTLDHVDGIFLTEIDADYEGDAFYPQLPSQFKERERSLIQDDPKIELVFYEKDNA